MANGWTEALRAESDNAFDAVRLILASMVVLEHSYFLTSNSFAGDPLFRLTHGQTNSGAFAVAMFFAISGFLVTQSYVNTGDVRRYLLKRAARIFPGFLTATAVALLILGPLLSVGAAAYFLQQKWLGIGLQAVTLHQTNPSGVLAGAPVPLLHGTLWSIVYEFDCYLVVAALGVTGLLRKRWAVWSVCLLLMGLLAAKAGLFATPVIDRGPLALLVSNPVRWPDVVPFFLVGSLFAVYGDFIAKTRLMLAVATAALFVSAVLGGLSWVLIFAGTYAVLFACVSLRGAIRLNGRKVDLSYGVYLYGWPVTQVLVYATHNSLRPEALFIATLAIAAPLALASWMLIEQPALRAASRRAVRPTVESPAGAGVSRSA